MPESTFREVWKHDLEPTALLSDTQIRQAIEECDLLINRAVSYDPESVKYASYEVHAAPEVGRVDFLDDGELEEAVRSQTREISIAAGDTVRLFTQEHFSLPADVFATVTGLGQLYAAGLTVGSTYVDPGTSYRIYLSVSNVSDREVIIPAGSPIGRAQFFVLGTPARVLKRSAWRTDLGYRKGASPSGTDKDEVLRRLEALEARNESLDIGSAGATDASARVADTVNAIRDLRRVVRLQGIWLSVLVALMAVVLIPEGVWAWLSGTSLPPILRFVIPAVAGGLVYWGVTRILKRTLEHLRDRSDS